MLYYKKSSSQHDQCAILVFSTSLLGLAVLLVISLETEPTQEHIEQEHF